MFGTGLANANRNREGMNGRWNQIRNRRAVAPGSASAQAIEATPATEYPTTPIARTTGRVSSWRGKCRTAMAAENVAKPTCQPFGRIRGENAVRGLMHQSVATSAAPPRQSKRQGRTSMD